MQMVILAGGLATRLNALAKNCPKSMVDIAGKPFMEHQLALLRRGGIKDVIICVGHLAQPIVDYFGDGGKFGLRIRYSYDGDRLLGTGGALKKAESLLEGYFFLIYGDSYLAIPFAEALQTLQSANKSGLMVVYRNRNLYDKSNVIVRDGMVAMYDKKRSLSEMQWIDAGITLLKRETLAAIPPGKGFSLANLLSDLVGRNELQAWKMPERFYEIGSVQGLEEFRAKIEEISSLDQYSGPKTRVTRRIGGIL
jgi:NDP-sugar pyrophosphorylase family protein